MTVEPLAPSARRFLFLQGPPGPFFRQLGEALARAGAGVFRINLSGGDERDWPHGAQAYRGTMSGWPLYFDRYVVRHRITDVVLFGDCRPVHSGVARLARLRGIHVHVFEEGYIRPGWMTLERDGVNGYSPFDRRVQAIRAAAATLPEMPEPPPVTASFGRRARDAYWHYHAVVIGRLLLRYPFYRSHRPGSMIGEGLGWLRRLALRRRRAREAERALAGIAGRSYFLFPLQLSGDYQIRAHSPFRSMAMAVEYVLASFALHAPGDALLVVKEHPLDVGWRDWRRSLRRRARKHGLAGRVVHIDGGDLESLCQDARGVVCVNSTAGTLALAVGTPVIVLGDAVYDVPGVTYQGLLDRFWTDPRRPDMAIWRAFRKVLQDQCLIRGGIASESATRMLVANAAARMLAPAERAARPIRRRVVNGGGG